LRSLKFAFLIGSSQQTTKEVAVLFACLSNLVSAQMLGTGNFDSIRKTQRFQDVLELGLLQVSSIDKGVLCFGTILVERFIDNASQNLLLGRKRS